MSDASVPPALSFSGVTKRWGNITALNDISYDVRQGTIHALIGENGAGKSTCLGITSGRISQTSGDVKVNGQPAATGDPRGMRLMGVATIYQELTIAPNLTPTQNVFLGKFKSKFGGVLDSRAMRKEYERLAEEIGVDVQPEVPCSQLSVAEQQMLEIARGLASGARVLLFDEPTAALARSEREAFLRLAKRLRSEGYTIVFVSHNLDEVLEISDRITVFREGQMVADMDRSEVTKHDLVVHMLGEDKSSHVIEDAIEGHGHLVDREFGEDVLTVENVRLPGQLSDISLNVRAGEILGIGGLVGSGRTELLRCMFGLEPRSSGVMRIKGETVRWPSSVQEALKYRISLLPEDRKHEGIIPLVSSAENVGLGRLKVLCGSWIVTLRKMLNKAAEPATNYGFNMSRLSQPAGKLSGGNQQKLLLARSTLIEPLIFLADEPTRGIDIGAKAEIMASLRALTDKGCAVIVVSSELDEVVAISDRVVVLHDGHKAGEIDGTKTPLSIAGILKMAFGVEEENNTAQPQQG